MSISSFRFDFRSESGGPPLRVDYNGEDVTLFLGDSGGCVLTDRDVTRLRVLLEMAEGPDGGPRAYRHRGEDA